MKETTRKMTSKRELIINAAVHVFSRKGYHNARMEEIAAVAGIGKATIYEYFSSKLQLFQEMIEKSLSIYYDSMNSEQIKLLTIEDRIQKLAESHINFCKKNSELTRIIFWDTQIIDEELKEWINETRKKKQNRLQAIIEEGISRGELVDHDPGLISLIISGIIGSLWVPIVLEKLDVDAKLVAKQITDIIMNGIKKE